MTKLLNFTYAAVLALSGLVLLLAGCATNPHYVADGPKFYEEADANLIVRYSSENTVFMLRPDGHEGPFQQIFTRQELCDKVAVQPGERNLAVVIINHYFMRDLELQVKAGWRENLNQLHFRRIVFLRGNDRGNVNGLRIVSDTQLAGREPSQTNAVFASVIPPGTP